MKKPSTSKHSTHPLSGQEFKLFSQRMLYLEQLFLLLYIKSLFHRNDHVSLFGLVSKEVVYPEDLNGEELIMTSEYCTSRYYSEAMLRCHHVHY
jgi:hypothetical protein